MSVLNDYNEEKIYDIKCGYKYLQQKIMCSTNSKTIHSKFQDIFIALLNLISGLSNLRNTTVKVNGCAGFSVTS